MLKFTFKYDFSDVRKALDDLEKQARKRVEEVGEKAVEYAKEHGNYRDVTGRLRASNKFEVVPKKGGAYLRLYNDAPYATDVEEMGKDVLSSAALYAEKLLKEGDR